MLSIYSCHYFSDTVNAGEMWLTLLVMVKKWHIRLLNWLLAIACRFVSTYFLLPGHIKIRAYDAVSQVVTAVKKY